MLGEAVRCERIVCENVPGRGRSDKGKQFLRLWGMLSEMLKDSAKMERGRRALETCKEVQRDLDKNLTEVVGLVCGFQ